MIDSFESRILCGDRTWKSVDTLGRKGHGPGEFQAPSNLTRGPEGEVGVVDYRLERFTVFEEGRLVKTLAVPTAFRPLSWRPDSVVVGLFDTFQDSVRTAPVAWLSLSADSVVDSSVLRHSSPATRSLGVGIAMGNGVMSPDGHYVFWVDGYTLARYSPNGRFLAEFTSPAHQPELPGPRDVEDYQEGARWLFGAPLPHEDVERYSTRPKHPLVRGAPMAFDDRSRLWVATTRGHDETSSLDVFERERFLGTVEIRDRLLWFDVLDTTLAALVERSDETLAIDWYTIE